MVQHLDLHRAKPHRSRREDTITQRRPSKPIPPRGPLFGWSHPGETVAEEIATRGLTADGFAAELGCPVAELEGLLTGVLPVTPALATALERAWGAEAAFWMRLQAHHDEAIHPGVLGVAVTAC